MKKWLMMGMVGLGLVLAVAACTPKQIRTTAQVNAAVAIAVDKAQQAEITLYNTHKVTETQHLHWQRVFGQVAQAGLALNAALVNANTADAKVQVAAMLGLIEQLMNVDLLQLPVEIRLVLLPLLQAAQTALVGIAL
jgi:hypothetical protein